MLIEDLDGGEFHVAPERLAALVVRPHLRVEVYVECCPCIVYQFSSEAEREAWLEGPGDVIRRTISGEVTLAELGVLEQSHVEYEPGEVDGAEALIVYARRSDSDDVAQVIREALRPYDGRLEFSFDW